MRAMVSSSGVTRLFGLSCSCSSTAGATSGAPCWLLEDSYAGCSGFNWLARLSSAAFSDPRDEEYAGLLGFIWFARLFAAARWVPFPIPQSPPVQEGPGEKAERVE